MSEFQGSGFVLDVPEGCADASVYTFLLPTEGQFTPYVTIKFEGLHDEADLNAYVTKQHDALSESVEKFEMIIKRSGKRGIWAAVLAIMEWGAEESRIRQKQGFFLVPGETAKVYALTGIDLAAHFDKSEPQFDKIFQSFNPNDIQVIEA